MIPSPIPRSALITGGAKRVGRGIALALASRGFSIALHCRDSRSDAEHTASEIRALGVDCVILHAALENEDEVRRLVPHATEALGAIGVLINNASVFERDEWDDVTRESWDAHLGPNLRAPFVLIQDFARLLPPQDKGLVVNMLDQRVWSLTPHFVSYTVSKAALWTLTQTMALALAPRIRVNGIGPGPTVPSPRQTEAQFVAQSASVPLKHGSSPAEIGAAVLAMLDLPAMTGQMIALDGGQHLQWSPVGVSPVLEE